MIFASHMPSNIIIMIEQVKLTSNEAQKSCPEHQLAINGRKK
jgi:hypothetical protein